MNHDFDLERIIYAVMLDADLHALKAKADIHAMGCFARRSMGQVQRWRKV